MPISARPIPALLSQSMDALSLRVGADAVVRGDGTGSFMLGKTQRVRHGSARIDEM